MTENQQQQPATLRQVYEEAIQNIDKSLSRCDNAQSIARVGARSYEEMMEQLADAGQERKNQGNGDLPPHLVKALLTIARVCYIRCAVYHIDQYEPSEKLVQDLWGSPPKKLRQQYKMAEQMLPLLFAIEEAEQNQQEDQE